MSDTVNELPAKVEHRQMFSWSPWWDTSAKVVSLNPPIIHDKWRALMAEVGALKAVDKDGVKFKIKAAFGPNGLMSKLRPALDKLELTAMVVEQDAKALEVERGTCVFTRSILRLCAADGSWVQFSGIGQGADSQDKAGGKAHTYAWKCAWITFLNLDDAEIPDTDDESEPIKAGPKRGKQGTFKLDHDEYKERISDADDLEELEEIVKEIRETGTRNDAVELAPAIKLARKELKKVAPSAPVD